MKSKKEKQKKFVSAVIQNVNHSSNGNDGNLTFDLGRTLSDAFYPIGCSSRFVYDIGNGYFTHFDESVYNLTGFYPNEIVFSDTAAFILQLVLDEHINIVAELTQQSFSLCKDFMKHDSFCMNLEYNIKSKTGENKRLLTQYTPAYYEEDGYPKINIGRLVDITHMKKDGIPILYVAADNKLIYCQQGNPQQMIRSENVIFSNREIEVLRLISEGFAIKEIAGKLSCSIATIYTHRKNIRLKSQEDINKVIVNLRERGII